MIDVELSPGHVRYAYNLEIILAYARNEIHNAEHAYLGYHK